MSLKTFLFNLTHSRATHTAVEKIKADPVGGQIAQAIAAASTKNVSGAEKMEDVLSKAMPLVLTIATKGGANVLLRDVETLARNVIESFLLDAEQAIVAAVNKAL
jgi:hypothetical protein